MVHFNLTMNLSTYRTKLTRHIQSRVAGQLGLSRSYISMVVNGHRTSARVERALEKEYARIERQVQRFERRLLRVAA